MGFIDYLFDTSGFPSRWYCGTAWTQALGWTHIISDCLIFLSYFSIPISLIYFLCKRQDIPFQKIFILFGCFILFCGLGHLIEAYIFWNPVYHLAALNKALTALVSLATSIILIMYAPQILALPKFIAVKAYLASIVESSVDGIISFDTMTHIKSINRSAEKLFNADETVIGKSLIEVLPSLYSQTPDLPEMIQTALKRRKENSYECEIEHSEGKYFLLVTISPVFSLEKSLIGGSFIIKNITQEKLTTQKLKNATQKLLESQRVYEDFYENAPDMFMSIDTQTHQITQCNQTLCKNMEYTKEEMMEKNLLHFYHPDCHEKIKRSWEILNENGCVQDMELILKKKNGGLIPVTLNLTGIRDETGTLVQTLATLRDITALRSAYEQIKAINHHLYLQQQNFKVISERLNAILNSAVDCIITMDNKGIIETVNSAVEKIFGYSQEELIGKNLKMLMPQDYTHKNINAYLEKISPHLNNTGREALGRRKNRSTLPLELAISEMKLENESKFTAIVRDITERKKIQTNLINTYKELETFVYIASHDLKEPLRGIHQYATFLLEDYESILPEGGKKKLVTMQEMATRMHQFIDSLLHYSRISHEEDPFQLVNLNQVVESILQRIQVTLENNKVKIETKSVLPSILCNKIGLEEVFQNLILNSLKYNDKPIVHIEISHIESTNEKNSHEYTFYVKDNGIGIDQRHFQSIFKIFTRLHHPHKYGEGTGAGLTIVKKIIEKHNGKIWVESIVGEGTTVYFTIEKKER